MSDFISPLDDRIVVEVELGEKITAGGLIIPDTAQFSGNREGIVVAAGRGHRTKKGRIQPLDIQVGDKVLLSEHAGDSIQVLGRDVKIVRESEVLGVLEK